MKFYEMGLDVNGRSRCSIIECPVHKVSETESLSNKQPGVYWRLGFRNNNTTPIMRTDKRYTSASGPYEMHVGGSPHFIGIMANYSETTMQDGAVWRMGAGDFLYVTPGALHHSNNNGHGPVIIFNLYLPGTAVDNKPLEFK